MRLLDKKTIVQQKNQERQLEIQEGLKLAKKVDTLRETAAVEEKKLNTFRDESIKRVKEDIEALTLKRDNLRGEISVLEDRRKDLQQPLDAEWEKIERKKLELSGMENSLADKLKLLESNEKEYKKRDKELKLEEGRIADMKERAEKLLADTAKKNSEAEKALSSAHDQSDVILKRASAREKDVINRELEVAAKERDIINMSEKVARDREILDLRERAINDKYQQLIRTTKELKKHGRHHTA